MPSETTPITRMREQAKLISSIMGSHGLAEMTGVAEMVSLSSQGAAFVLLSLSYRGRTDLEQGVLEDILHKHDEVQDKGAHLGSCF